MLMQGASLLGVRRTSAFIVSLIVVSLMATLVGVAFVYADHDFTPDPRMYGYVMDAGQPVPGANVKHCWDPTTQPDISTCFPSSTDVSQSDGHWVYPFPATNYFYVFWAEKDGVMSQLEYTFYTGGQLSVTNLILSGLNMPPGSGDGPDLKVKDLTYSYPKATGPEAGDMLGFSGTVENKGDGDAPATSTALRIDIGNDGFWDVFPAVMFTGFLPEDASEEVRWDDIWTAVLGTHAFEICADDTFVVMESDESISTRMAAKGFGALRPTRAVTTASSTCR